jgi:hypothetical protein
MSSCYPRQSPFHNSLGFESSTLILALRRREIVAHFLTRGKHLLSKTEPQPVTRNHEMENQNQIGMRQSPAFTKI